MSLEEKYASLAPSILRNLVDLVQRGGLLIPKVYLTDTQIEISAMSAEDYVIDKDVTPFYELDGIDELESSETDDAGNVDKDMLVKFFEGNAKSITPPSLGTSDLENVRSVWLSVGVRDLDDEWDDWSAGFRLSFDPNE